MDIHSVYECNFIHSLINYLFPDGCHLCYTLIVDDHHQIWKIWVRNLHHWGLQEWVASFLEITGPVNFIGAQFVYICQPLLKRTISDYNLEALSGILEDPAQTKSFISMLREAEPR